MRISSAIMPAFSFYSHKMPQKTYFTGQDVFVKSASKKEDSKKEDMINTVVSEFQQLEGVEAIGIGGSSASKRTDNSSDVDVYIFTNKDIPISEREKIIKKYSSRHEIGQEYFGAGDEFRVDSTGTEFDVMYFDKKWIEDNYDNVWVKHNASNGYTTCFLYTLSIMDEKFDRTGWLKGMKEKLNTPYPKELQDNIIKRNMMLLKDKPFASYLEQLQKAVNRGDENSVNHRTSAFLASYFDIIFAKNELLHPGEKRLVQYAKDNCTVLPKDFEKDVCDLTTSKSSKKPKIADRMVENLREIL